MVQYDLHVVGLLRDLLSEMGSRYSCRLSEGKNLSVHAFKSTSVRRQDH